MARLWLPSASGRAACSRHCVHAATRQPAAAAAAAGAGAKQTDGWRRRQRRRQRTGHIHTEAVRHVGQQAHRGLPQERVVLPVLGAAQGRSRIQSERVAAGRPSGAGRADASRRRRRRQRGGGSCRLPGRVADIQMLSVAADGVAEGQPEAGRSGVVAEVGIQVRQRPHDWIASPCRAPVAMPVTPRAPNKARASWVSPCLARRAAFRICARPVTRAQVGEGTGATKGAALHPRCAGQRPRLDAAAGGCVCAEKESTMPGRPASGCHT